jgi:hypothetical protein
MKRRKFLQNSITLTLGSIITPMVVSSAVNRENAPDKKISAGQITFENMELSFDLGGPDAVWHPESQGKSKARYTWQGYSLHLNLESKGIQKILHFKLEPPAGKKLSVKSYTAKVSMSTTGLHAVMVPNTRKIAHTLLYYHEHRTWPENPKIYRCLIPEGFEENAAVNHEAPFVLLTDSEGNNALSVGFAVADQGTKIKGEAVGESYVLTLVRQEDQPFTGDKLEDALIVSTATKSWIKVEEAYARTFDEMNGRKRTKAPEWAFEPVFCTWYCYDDHITQDGVMKIAKKCKELGFGTILIDAGWDCKPDGGYADFETGILGDYIAVPDRFPDMPGLVRQIHDMGLRVELWSGPFWEGKESHSYKEKTKDYHIWNEKGVTHELCPKYPNTRVHLKEKFTWIAKTYGIDGMWLDAADSVPTECKASHEHLNQTMGEAFVDCMVAIHEGLRSVNPESITEGRVLHANLNTKTAFDIIQPSDAPKSFEFLRLAGIHIRPWVYDIVFKNDPMNWQKDADAATIGKFLSTMVCNGVPALSVDYLTAPEDQCNLTKAWLSFFQKHKKTLLDGEFKLFGADYGSPDMMLVGIDEAVVYLKNPNTTEVVLPRTIRKVILLNCTNSDNLKVKIIMADGRYTVQSYLPDWTLDGSSIQLGAPGMFAHRVPQGGAAIVM